MATMPTFFRISTSSCEYRFHCRIGPIAHENVVNVVINHGTCSSRPMASTPRWMFARTEFATSFESPLMKPIGSPNARALITS